MRKMNFAALALIAAVLSTPAFAATDACKPTVNLPDRIELERGLLLPADVKVFNKDGSVSILPAGSIVQEKAITAGPVEWPVNTRCNKINAVRGSFYGFGIWVFN